MSKHIEITIEGDVKQLRRAFLRAEIRTTKSRLKRIRLYFRLLTIR